MKRYIKCSNNKVETYKGVDIYDDGHIYIYTERKGQGRKDFATQQEAEEYIDSECEGCNSSCNIKSATAVDKSYIVIVNFAGIVGCEEEYVIYADNEVDAEEAALREAEDDLTVDDWTQISETEWEVDVNFANLLGCSNTYTVIADSENEAFELATEEAIWDLSVEDIISE